MFTEPFPGMKETNPMNRTDLIRALRLDITGELDAIQLYTAHAESTDVPLVMNVLHSIANEERVHVGELQKLIEILDPEERKFLDNGAVEVENFKEFAGNWSR